MTAKDVYRPPFHTDGCYIYSKDGVMSLMAGDCDNYPEKMMSRVCEILNGTCQFHGNPDVRCEDDMIYIKDNLFLVVRGFGHLTSSLGLSYTDACKIQDEFAIIVASRLRGEI